MATDVGTLRAYIDADTSHLSRGLKNAEKDVSGFSKRGSKAFDGMTKAVGGLTAMLGGLSVAMAGAFVLKTGAGFEQQMAKVKAVTAGGVENFKALSDSAREMGRTTEWTAQQSAQALEFLGLSGMSAVQAMAALPGTLDLATAGSLDLGRAADIASDVMTAFSIAAEDISRVNDALVNTSTNANTTVEMLGESFKQVTGAAASLGYSIEDTSAMLGVLANAGIKGGQAGTHLRQMMLKNAKAAEILGTAENDLIGTLKAAEAAGWDVTDMREQYGIIASASAAILMKGVAAVDGETSSYTKLNTALKEGADKHKEIAAIMRDTTMGAFKELKSAVEALAIDAFMGMRTEILAGIEVLKSLVTWISNNKEGFKALWEVIKVGGGLIKQYLIDPIMAAFEVWGRFAGALGEVAAVIETGASAHGGWMGFVKSQLFEMPAAADTAKQSIQSLAEEVDKPHQMVIEMSGVMSPVQPLGTVINKAKSKLEELGKKASQPIIVRADFTQFSAGIDQSIARMNEMQELHRFHSMDRIEMVRQETEIKNLEEQIWYDNFIEKQNLAKELHGGNTDEMLANYFEFIDGSNVADTQRAGAFTKVTTDMGGIFATNFTGLMTGELSSFGEFWDSTWKSIVSSFLNNIIPELLGGVSKLFGGLSSSLGGFMSSIGSGISGIVGSVGGGISGLVSGIGSGIGGAVSSVVDSVGGFLGFKDGAFSVPTDMFGLMHKGEMVLPAGEAANMQAAIQAVAAMLGGEYIPATDMQGATVRSYGGESGYGAAELEQLLAAAPDNTFGQGLHEIGRMFTMGMGDYVVDAALRYKGTDVHGEPQFASEAYGKAADTARGKSFGKGVGASLSGVPLVGGVFGGMAGLGIDAMLGEDYSYGGSSYSGSSSGYSSGPFEGMSEDDWGNVGFAKGGITSGPKSGYPAILHGTEAIVPLPDNFRYNEDSSTAPTVIHLTLEMPWGDKLKQMIHVESDKMRVLAEDMSAGTDSLYVT